MKTPDGCKLTQIVHAFRDRRAGYVPSQAMCGAGIARSPCASTTNKDRIGSPDMNEVTCKKCLWALS